MKTKVEWRHGDRVLKLDDTSYEGYPEDGDIIELQEDGETHRFQVQGTEKAVVILELAEDQHADVTQHGEVAPEPLTTEQKSARARKAQRLADETETKKTQRKFKVAVKKKK